MSEGDHYVKIFLNLAHQRTAVKSIIKILIHHFEDGSNIRSSDDRGFNPIFVHKALHSCVPKNRLTPSRPLSVAPFLCFFPLDDT